MVRTINPDDDSASISFPLLLRLGFGRSTSYCVHSIG
jgi:hypothetical protein